MSAAALYRLIFLPGRDPEFGFVIIPQYADILKLANFIFCQHFKQRI